MFTLGLPTAVAVISQLLTISYRNAGCQMRHLSPALEITKKPCNLFLLVPEVALEKGLPTTCKPRMGSFDPNVWLTYHSLAYAEIRSILARVLWNFELQLECESDEWLPQKEFVFWDKPSLWVNLRHRGG